MMQENCRSFAFPDIRKPHPVLEYGGGGLYEFETGLRLNIPEGSLALKSGVLKDRIIGDIFFDAYLPQGTLMKRDIKSILFAVHGAAAWPQIEDDKAILQSGDKNARHYFDRMLGPLMERLESKGILADTAIVFPRMPGGGGSQINRSFIEAIIRQEKSGGTGPWSRLDSIHGYTRSSVKAWALALDFFSSAFRRILDVSADDTLVLGNSIGGSAVLLAKAWGMEGRVAALNSAFGDTVFDDKKNRAAPVNLALALERLNPGMVVMRRPFKAFFDLLSPFVTFFNGRKHDVFRKNLGSSTSSDAIVASGVSMFLDEVSKSGEVVLAQIPQDAKDDVTILASLRDTSVSAAKTKQLARGSGIVFRVLDSTHDAVRDDPGCVADCIAELMTECKF